MKKSEQIAAEIRKLEAEYKKAQEEESLEIIWNGNVKHLHSEKIGCFDMTKTRTILQYLASQRICILSHPGFGKWAFRMNAQCNRIFVEPYGRTKKPFSVNINEQESINEDNVLKMIMLASGDWYILNGELEKVVQEKIFK